jgi:hypothetical protein
MSDGIRGSMREYRRRERGKKGVEDRHTCSVRELHEQQWWPLSLFV